MTTEKDITKAVQELNVHVTEMFNEMDARMKKEHGKSILDQMQSKEVLALNASIAQVSRTYAVAMAKYIPQDDLSKLDKYKIMETIKCCEGLIDECTGALAETCVKRYAVCEDDEEDEDDDIDWMEDDSFISEMTSEAQEKRLKCLRAVPEEELRTVLKESGLTKKQIDWCVKKIHDEDQSLGDDDTDIGLDVLKKLKGI